jgi:hypothetical protein
LYGRTLAFAFLGGILLSLCSLVISVYPCGTLLQTMPRVLSWNAVARVAGDEFANHHMFLVFALATLTHGVLCIAGMSLLWFIGRKILPNPKRLHLAVLVTMLVLYAFVLLLAWPLKDCL